MVPTVIASIGREETVSRLVPNLYYPAPFYRSFTRITNFSPDHVSSTAHSLLIARP